MKQEGRKKEKKLDVSSSAKKDSAQSETFDLSQRFNESFQAFPNLGTFGVKILMLGFDQVI